MDIDMKEIFNNGTLYPVYSVRTGKPYMTGDREALVFESAEEAGGYVFDKKDMEVKPRKKPKYAKFMNSCYMLGFRTILLKLAAEKEPRVIAVGPQGFFREFCNPEINKAFLMFAETNEKRYLMEFSEKEFIVPVKIDESNEGDHMKPIVRHVAVGVPKKSGVDAPDLYLAFTDLRAYRRWSGHPVWDPIKVRFWQLREIVGESGIVLNPESPGAVYIKPEILGEIPSDVPPIGEIRHTTDETAPKERKGQV